MLRRPKTITLQQRAPKTLKPQQARQLIRRFHILQKNKAIILAQLRQHDSTIEESNYAQRLGKVYHQEHARFKLRKNLELFKLDKLTPDELAKALARIDAEIEQRGGLHVYQMASTVGQDHQRGGDSLKWLVKWFKELGRTADNALEIGCLSPNNAILNSKMFGEVTRIDLNSQSPHILQQDFMKRPLPESNEDKFDVISCSLVLNFVPTPAERGDMLRRMTKFLRLTGSAAPAVFLVLPLPCVTNSRYFDAALLDKIMTSLGFTQVRYHEAQKVGYWLYDWLGEAVPRYVCKKKELHAGANRNNFHIVLQ